MENLQGTPFLLLLEDFPWPLYWGLKNEQIQAQFQALLLIICVILGKLFTYLRLSCLLWNTSMKEKPTYIEYTTEEKLNKSGFPSSVPLSSGIYSICHII